MFHRSSFQPASFKPVSWRFDSDVPQPQGPTVVPYGRAGAAKKRRKRRTDDPLALLVWLHELS